MVDRADINSVLSNIRDLRAQVAQSQRQQSQAIDRIDRPQGPQAVDPTGETREVPGFGEMLNQAVNQVNDLQKQSGNLAERYTKGDPSVDITRVMIASQKSGIAFEALTQVRNRVVRAYEDIMNMPI